MRRGYKIGGKVCGGGSKFRIGALLNLSDVLSMNIDGIEYYLTMNIDGIEYYIAMN